MGDPGLGTSTARGYPRGSPGGPPRGPPRGNPRGHPGDTPGDPHGAPPGDTPDFGSILVVLPGDPPPRDTPPIYRRETYRIPPRDTPPGAFQLVEPGAFHLPKLPIADGPRAASPRAALPFAVVPIAVVPIAVVPCHLPNSRCGWIALHDSTVPDPTLRPLPNIHCSSGRVWGVGQGLVGLGRVWSTHLVVSAMPRFFVLSPTVSGRSPPTHPERAQSVHGASPERAEAGPEEGSSSKQQQQQQ